jgi:lipopolysaccharide transport system ATP-binding protein
MSKVITVENLSKSYVLGARERDTMLRSQLVHAVSSIFRPKARGETLWALSDVSFSIAPGEVVGIIGRNGSGKSTLLKVLSRITYPTSGKIKVEGRVASLLEVGTGFHEELTGRENVMLNGSILGMKRTEVISKLDDIVSYAGVERFVDTPIKRYSSGMRLRLGFAVAAHLDPDVLIVDEVLAVGDAGFQKKCLNTMEGMRSGGRTVLFVSHNMAAVENLCTRGIWIDGGRLRMDGPTRDVIEAYMSTFASVQAASIDLSDFEGRRGLGTVRFTGLEFLDREHNSQQKTPGGEPLIMRFHYKAKSSIAPVSFGFRLMTEFGTLVTEVSTSHYDLVMPKLAIGEGFIDLEIESLNLMPGRYYLTLGIASGAGDLQDALDNCARLDVEQANIYGSSQQSDSRHGIMFFAQRWNTGGVRAA